MSNTVLVRLRLRQGTAAEWTAANPVLAAGEMGWESDTKRLRIGDGSTAFVSLPSYADATSLAQAVQDAEAARDAAVAAAPVASSTAPAATVAGRLWIDTSGALPLLKVRNAANSAWVTLGTFAATGFEAAGLANGGVTTAKIADAAVTEPKLATGAVAFAKIAAAALASQAEAEAGSSASKLMTPQRAEQHMLANALGWGQSWADYDNQRSPDTAYQNTTGRPIMVSIMLNGSTIYKFEVSSNNSTWLTLATGSSVRTNVTQIVPPGWWYRVSGGPAAIVDDVWRELR